jgi:2-keto-3-deoxy-L-rhamnonate aldolase RhmA
MTDLPEAGLRAKLARGDIVVALRTAISITPEALKRALGRGSYDLVYTDLQHSPYTEHQLHGLCAAAEDLGYPVEIRIPHTRYAHLAGRLCDFGPAAILVPEVMQPDDVRQAIENFFYPPFGKRSFGGSTRFGMKTRPDARDYASWWNRTAVLGLQLESVEAVINARQLAVPGVGYVSFGPTDLGFSLDAHPAFPFRTVEACMRHVAGQLQGTGVPLGLAVTLGPEERKKYQDAGLTVFQEAAIVDS